MFSLSSPPSSSEEVRLASSSAAELCSSKGSTGRRWSFLPVDVRLAGGGGGVWGGGGGGGVGGGGGGRLCNWTPARAPPAPGHGGQGRELVCGDL